MSTTSRFHLFRQGVALAVAAVLMGVISQPAYAVDDIWELPGIGCEELGFASPGTLVFEETSHSHTFCVYENSAGTSLIGWQLPAAGNWSDAGWWVNFDEKWAESDFRLRQTDESFGTFYEVRDDDRDGFLDAQGLVDQASTQWGLHVSARTTYFGPPDAIAAMKTAISERVSVLNAEVDRQEDPQRNRDLFDPNALDCFDVWDGAGLDPDYELVTFIRNFDQLDCWIVEKGTNPFAWDTYRDISFGFELRRCPADLESIRENLSFYEFVVEESFGTYHFFNYSPSLVVGENTSASGTYFDEENCVTYDGWPEVITKMINARQNDDSAAVAATGGPAVAGPAPLFSRPQLVSPSSLFGVLSAIILAGVLLTLRRFLPADPPSSAAGQAAAPATQPEARRLGARLGVVIGGGLAALLGTVFINPVVRQQIAQDSLGLSTLVNHLAVWGIPIGLLTLAATLLVTLRVSGIQVLNLTQAIVSVILIVAAAVATAWPLVTSPILPLLGVLFAVVWWGQGAAAAKRQTVSIAVLVLASLGLLTLLGVDQLFTAIPEWAQQASLVTVGMTVASAALLALPVRSFPGAGVWASHPVMWTGAMAISWWLVITLASVTLVPTVALTVAAIVLVLISRPSGARINTPPPAVPGDIAPAAPPVMAAAEAPTATPAAAPVNAGMPVSDTAAMPQPPAQQPVTAPPAAPPAPPAPPVAPVPPAQQPVPPAPVSPVTPPPAPAAPPMPAPPAGAPAQAPEAQRGTGATAPPPGAPQASQTPVIPPPSDTPVLPTAESPAQFYPPAPPQGGSVPVPPGAPVPPGEPPGGDSPQAKGPVTGSEGPVEPSSEADGR